MKEIVYTMSADVSISFRGVNICAPSEDEAKSLFLEELKQFFKHGDGVDAVEINKVKVECNG